MQTFLPVIHIREHYHRSFYHFLVDNLMSSFFSKSNRLFLFNGTFSTIKKIYIKYCDFVYGMNVKTNKYEKLSSNSIYLDYWQKIKWNDKNLN